MTDQSSEIDHLSDRLRSIFGTLAPYRYLTDSYVIEFFVEDLWNRLPIDWRQFLDSIDFKTLADLLDLEKDFDDRSAGIIGEDILDRSMLEIPVDLLTLRKDCRRFSLKRTPMADFSEVIDGYNCDREGIDTGILCDGSIENGCRSSSMVEKNRYRSADSDRSKSTVIDRSKSKSTTQAVTHHMNPKKIHEITRLADLIDRLIDRRSDLPIDRSDHRDITLLDIGSGCGHLARYLNCSISTSSKIAKISTIEAREYFVERAKLFDRQTASKFPRRTGDDDDENRRSAMIEHRHEFFDDRSLLELEKSIDDGDNRLWMIGLHTCGDLAPAMLRSFANRPSIRALISVSCCYMKLTTIDCDRGGIDSGDRSMDDFGYPMSRFVREIDNRDLSCAARELSCHALEQFVDKLRHGSMDEIENSLKSHCYRAALEKLIRRKYPDRYRIGIRSIKNAHRRLNFEEYVRLALSKSTDDGIDSSEVIDGGSESEWQEMLDEWRRVAVFFSIRLLLAPLIESAVLIDRLLYLKELGFTKSTILAAFDAKISARNFLLLSLKD